MLLLDDESLLDGHQLLFWLRLVCEEEIEAVSPLVRHILWTIGTS